MARTQDMTPVDGGTLEFTPDTITLTEDPSGQYFTGDVYLNKNISGDYSLMDNAPAGTLTVTGHTGTQSETLTLQVPASFANQSCTLCAYGMDEAPAAALFFWAPAAANQQRIVTYVLDSTKSIFVRGFDDLDACIERVTKVFGVYSVSPALEMPKEDFDAICDQAIAMTKGRATL